MKRIKLDGAEVKISEGVQILHTVPRPLEFYSKYYLQHQPVLIRNAVDHWRALLRWKADYIYQMVGETSVHVELRPKYFPKEVVYDSRFNKHFSYPLVREITVETFLRRLLDSRQHIHNLRCDFMEKFPLLLYDVTLTDLNFITDSWGPSILDFCIDDGRAITGLQENTSENLYVVISGYKKFILVPPFQKCYVPYRHFPAAKYVQDGFHMYLERMNVHKQRVLKEWVAIDPLDPDLMEFPEYKHCTPLEVRVNAGDILYVPHHYMQHVRQSDRCISLNGHYENVNFTDPCFTLSYENSHFDFKPFGIF